MAKLKGSPKTGGRQKGTQNKATSSVTEQLDALGCDPIAGMVKLAELSMEAKDYAMAFQCFKELAQYKAAKRKAIEVTGELGLDVHSKILVEFQDMPNEFLDD
jgi:hypothetical protein